MSTLLRTLSLAALALAIVGCRSNRGDPVANQTLNETVYTRVGMHFDAKRGRYLMYSTNYLSMRTYVAPGTQMTLTSVTGKALTLTDTEGNDYIINWVPKHSMMPMQEWRERHFSTSPVTLPETLTDDERDAIANGECRVGMSREAVFLAVGYPPKSTNPSQSAKVLVYEARRFVRRSVRFGEDDRVTAVGR